MLFIGANNSKSTVFYRDSKIKTIRHDALLPGKIINEIKIIKKSMKYVFHDEGNLYVYQISDDSLYKKLETGGKIINSYTVTDTFVIAIADNRHLYVYDFEKNSFKAIILSTDVGELSLMVASTNQKEILSVYSRDKQLCCRMIPLGRLRDISSENILIPELEHISDLSISKCKATIGVVYYDGEFRISVFQFKDRDFVKIFNMAANDITKIALSPDSQYLAAASDKLNIYDMAGKIIYTSNKISSVDKLMFGDMNRILFVDGGIRMLDLRTGTVGLISDNYNDINAV